jgi:hypothetical protein
MMIGMALVTFRAPPATNPTTIDVVVEEDWIREVARIPMNKPTNGLVVVSIRVSARPFPNILRDVPINSKLKRNKYRKNNKKMMLKKTACCW